MSKISTKQILILVTIFFVLGLAYYNQIASQKEVLNKASSLTLEVNSTAADKTLEQNENRQIIVHLSGEVKNPGVYKLKNKERLIDLIKAAGGLGAKADLDQINLAEKIADGQKIVIPSILNRKLNKTNGSELIEAVNSNSNKKVFANFSNPVQNELVNINKADQRSLESLSGIGPAKAKAIIKYRQQKLFNKKEDLLNISGIGEKTLEKLENEITLQ